MDQNVVIRTQWGCALVSRARQLPDGSKQYEQALNTMELALAALAAVVAQGGTRWIDGEYNCPADIAAQARWASEAPLLAAA